MRDEAVGPAVLQPHDLADAVVGRPDAPEDGDGDSRPRSRAEIALMAHKFMDQYDILAFDPGPIIVTNNVASAQAAAKFRHKKSGKVLETRFFHDWTIADGKATELRQRHDREQLKAFLASVDDGAA